MNSRTIYWALIVLALAAVGVSVMMHRSPVESTRHTGSIIGWSAIAVVVIARFFRPSRQTPPPVKDSDQ